MTPEETLREGFEARRADKGIAYSAVRKIEATVLQLLIDGISVPEIILALDHNSKWLWNDLNYDEQR